MENRIFVTKGDIVRAKTEAIVNAANTSLLGGGGVDGAIHKAAGPALLAECELLHGCKTGEAKLTAGYKLLAKYVIHTPGPIWRGGGQGEGELLKNCYYNSLSLALEHEIKTISFPSISTGVYRFPVKQAAEIALNAIYDFLLEHKEIERVNMVLYDEETYEIYKRALQNIFKEKGKTNIM